MMTIRNVFVWSVFRITIMPSKTPLCICLEDTRVRVDLYISLHPPPLRFTHGKCANSYPGLVKVAISTADDSINQVSTNPMISRFLPSMKSLISNVLLHMDGALIIQNDKRLLRHDLCRNVYLSYAYRAFRGLQR